jgi:hypothetical protein
MQAETARTCTRISRGSWADTCKRLHVYRFPPPADGSRFGRVVALQLDGARPDVDVERPDPSELQPASVRDLDNRVDVPASTFAIDALVDDARHRLALARAEASATAIVLVIPELHGW